jgi:hypothetical protein
MAIPLLRSSVRKNSPYIRDDTVPDEALNVKGQMHITRICMYCASCCMWDVQEHSTRYMELILID